MEEVSKTVYSKVCKYCGKEYTSTSRNQKYCCQECSDKAQKKNKAIKKKRARRRKEYDENREINQALSAAYSLAHKVADLYMIPKVCGCGSYDCCDGECEGELQLHHRDFNPFNNHPKNLVYLASNHHAQVHADAKDSAVNMVETYKEGIDLAGFEEDDEKYKVMIAHLDSKLQGKG